MDKEKEEMAAYQAGPFDDVKVQEALTIISVYAAGIEDDQVGEIDVKRLEAILERHPLFVARKKEIFSLINKFVNVMKTNDPHSALKIAADALAPAQRTAAFELAAEVALQHKDPTADKKKVLDMIKTRLSIGNGIAREVRLRYE